MRPRVSSLRAQRSVISLGRHLRQARLSRRLTMADLAERAGVSEKTVQRLEKGDPGVGVGTLAAVLAALGDPGGLERVLRPEDDPIGLSRAIEATPQRGRSSRRKAAGGRAGEADAPSGGEAGRGASSDDDGVGF